MKKNKIPELIKSANILIYDDENIHYFEGVSTSLGLENLGTTMRTITGDIYTTNEGYILNSYIKDLKRLENVKLDDTMMKRIAKFNKTRECLRLDKEIKEKEKRIEELDVLLKDKEKRWNKVKEYIKGIYELNLDEDDEEWYY